MTNTEFLSMVQAVAGDGLCAELETLSGLRERPDYHPEPSCLDHVRIVWERVNGNKTLAWVALLHDVAKLTTAQTNPKTGYPTSPSHDKVAAQWVREDRFCLYDRMVADGVEPESVAWLVENHMKAHLVHSGQMGTKKADVLRNHPLWDLLNKFAKADDMLSTEFTNNPWVFNL